MSSNTLFADRILSLAITGPLVRIELGVLQPPKGEGDKPELKLSENLVMPLEGFVASMGMLNAMINELIKQGVLKPQANNDAATQISTPTTKQ